MDDFGENKIIGVLPPHGMSVEPKYYKPSMATAMKTYRSKFSEEKRKLVNEYQAKKMAERRAKEKEEKKANGIETKIGRPKKKEGFTEKELKTMVDFLSQRVRELEESQTKFVPYWENNIQQTI